MDVHELEQALQDVVDASAGASDAFEAAWASFHDFTSQDFEIQPGLVAEALLAEGGVIAVLQQSYERHRKQGASTRQKILKCLLDLMTKLDPGVLAKYVPALLQAALYHTKNEETATPRIYALELLSLICSLMLEGQLPQALLPDPPLAVAAPLQRIFLSSEARKSKALRAALLGALGLLLELSIAAANSSQGMRTTQPRLQGVEALTRHWLLDMSRGELAGPDGQLSGADASQGAVEGMTAALQLMEPGEASADLTSMLHVVVSLVHELTAATRLGARNPTSYGKYKAAVACLLKLGPRFVAARLLTRPALVPAAVVAGGALGDTVQQQQQAVAVVLLECLLEVSANSTNKEMRAAAESAMTASARLLCQELLEVRSPDGAAVLARIISSCSAQVAGVTTSTAGAGGAATSSDVGSGGWMRGAVEILGQLCPAVGLYQGPQVSLVAFSTAACMFAMIICSALVC